MEKPSAYSSNNKILKLLPSFKNRHPFSPGREKPRADVNYSRKLKTHLSRGLSGPILSVIPAEARGKSSKDFETQEPTSPKVSCMGQIKHKHKICKQKHASLPKEFNHVSHSRPDKLNKARPEAPSAAPELKKKPSGIKKIFSAAGRKSDASADRSKPPLPDRAPSISQMRRFASSRDTLAGFDWTTAQIAPEDRDFDSDEDRGYSDREDDVIIPFSAPILVAGAGPRAGGGLALEPKKEINLWKRRTMAQPKPLLLNMVRAQQNEKK